MTIRSVAIVLCVLLTIARAGADMTARMDFDDDPDFPAQPNWPGNASDAPHVEVIGGASFIVNVTPRVPTLGGDIYANRFSCEQGTA